MNTLSKFSVNSSALFLLIWRRNGTVNFHLMIALRTSWCLEKEEAEIFVICFCLGWTEHFIVKINVGQSRCIRCLAIKCNTVCDEEKIRQLVSTKDPNLSKKFDRFLLESYIEDNRRVKWCPSVPHCGNAIWVEDHELYEVECPCGMQFCFSCLSEAHSPCSCLMWELWSKKCQDESETVNWITINTKPCPKCCKPASWKEWGLQPCILFMWAIILVRALIFVSCR